MISLKDRLRQLRKEHKFTQKAVADFLGISESAYGYYEQGRNEPSLESLKKLSIKYKVSIPYLVGETNTSKLEAEESDLEKLFGEGKLTYKGVELTEDQLEAVSKLLDVMIKDRLPK